MKLGRYGAPAAADILVGVVLRGESPRSEPYREAMALLARTVQAQGWGWWEGCRVDPVITAQATQALALGNAKGYRDYATLRARVRGAVESALANTQVIEYRVLLTAALLQLDAVAGKKYVAEAEKVQTKASPFARAQLAIALKSFDPKTAEQIIVDLEALVSQGDTESYLPVGEGLGWNASSEMSTAALLRAMISMNFKPDGWAKLATWMEHRSREGWLCADDQAEVALALDAYLRVRPERREVPKGRIIVDGTAHPLVASTVGAFATVNLSNVSLTPTSEVEVQIENGAATVQIDADTYVQTTAASEKGVRVVRRFEQRNAAGVWTEVTGAVVVGEPVRVTLSVWGDDIDDAIRVEEPVPAGFEFVEGESNYVIREEVRDGVVRHYLINAGTPVVIRYFLRPEAKGAINVRAVTAEYMRRTRVTGHTGTEVLEVIGDR